MAVTQKPNASNKNVEISAYNIDLLNEPTDFICGMVANPFQNQAYRGLIRIVLAGQPRPWVVRKWFF